MRRKHIRNFSLRDQTPNVLVYGSHSPTVVLTHLT